MNTLFYYHQAYKMQNDTLKMVVGRYIMYSDALEKQVALLKRTLEVSQNLNDNYQLIDNNNVKIISAQKDEISRVGRKVRMWQGISAGLLLMVVIK